MSCSTNRLRKLFRNPVSSSWWSNPSVRSKARFHRGPSNEAETFPNLPETQSHNEAIEMRPGAAAQALRHEQPASTDLITKIGTDALRRARPTSISRRLKRLKASTQQWCANQSVKIGGKACPKLPKTQQLGRKTTPDAIAETRQYGRVLRTDEGNGMCAIKEAHGPIRYNSSGTASQASSSSHHGRILLPGPNECFSADEKTTKAPLVNPMAYMEKMNSDTIARARAVLTPMASVRQAGAYVEQALHQQQQGENPGRQEAYADIGNIAQQRTANELTSSHSAGYPSSPYVHPDLRDRWAQCHWCCKWGMSLWPPVLPAGVLPLTDIDGLGYTCDVCYDWDELWGYPNAIQRCAQSLEHVMPRSLRDNTSVLATISAFVVWDEP